MWLRILFLGALKYSLHSSSNVLIWRVIIWSSALSLDYDLTSRDQTDFMEQSWTQRAVYEKVFQFLKSVMGYKDKFKKTYFGRLWSNNLVSIRAVRPMLEDSLYVRIPIHLFTHDLQVRTTFMYSANINYSTRPLDLCSSASLFNVCNPLLK